MRQTLAEFLDWADCRRLNSPARIERDQRDYQAALRQLGAALNRLRVLIENPPAGEPPVEPSVATT